MTLKRWSYGIRASGDNKTLINAFKRRYHTGSIFFHCQKKLLWGRVGSEEVLKPFKPICEILGINETEIKNY